MKSNEELLKIQLLNMIKILSAIFDDNNGEITIPEETMKNADIRFYVTADKKDGKLILTKTEGKGELYYNMFGKEN